MSQNKFFRLSIAIAVMALGLIAVPAMAGRAPARTSAPYRPRAAVKAMAARALGHLPLAFEPNVAESAPGADFVARGPGYSLALSRGGATLAARTGAKGQMSVVRMSLVGSEPAAVGVAGDPLEGRVNYLLGNDRSKWHTGVPTFGSVDYHNVYAGIDVRYYGRQGQLEYDLTVAPKADPGMIKLGFDGAQGLRLDSSGALVVATPAGVLEQHAPGIYQDVAGRRQPVSGRFVLLGPAQVGFAVGTYDHSRALVIDPSLAYSTFLGNPGGYDQGDAIAADASGNAYVTGDTDTGAFPTTPGAFQTTRPGNFSTFVAKLNQTGSALVYSTYIGGGAHGGDVNPHAIAIDTAGHAYVTGDVEQSDYPTTPGALQTAKPGNLDAYVTELNADGTGLVYSTFLGNSAGYDRGTGIAVDSSGDAFVTGDTDTGAFPTTPGAFQATRPGDLSSFVVKLNPSGTALIYSTYLGGRAGDVNPRGIAIDPAGRAYVTGEVEQSDYPTTPGAFQTTMPGSPDAYVTAVNADGTALVYSTYLGNSSGYDGGTAIAVDGTGDAYVTGDTDGGAFPTTPGAFQTTRPGNYSAFVTKLNPAGTAPVYSTYVSGADGNDVNPHGIAIDSDGHAYVTGDTGQSDYPVTADAYQTAARSAYLTKLNTTGSGLDYSTFFGGTVCCVAPLAIAFRDGRAYITGATGSSDMPTTPGAFQTTLPGGGADGFVTQFLFRDLVSITKTASTALVSAGQSVAYTLIVHNDGSVGPASGVTVTDPLPTGVTFVSATSSQGSCTQSGGTVTCALGALGAKSDTTVTITVNAPNASAKLVNTATVAASETDPDPADNTATAVVYVNAADMSLTKTASANPVTAGKNLTYTLTAANNGPTAATGVKVVDTLPAGVAFHSAMASKGRCHQAGRTVTCALGGLVVRAHATVTIVVVPPGGRLTNTATVTADQTDQAIANNTASVTTTVVGTGCGRVITKTTTLTADIGPCLGDGVIVVANNITLDLGGHRIFGFGTTDGTHPGIRMPDRTGVIIQNGEVSNFDAGIFINSGFKNTVTKMNVHDNVGPPDVNSELGDGILVGHSSSNLILNNTITRNGRFDGVGVFGLDSNFNLIQGNSIKNNVGEGIEINAFLEPSDPRRGNSIYANNVIGNTVTGNDAAGISTVSNLNALIKSNIVYNNGLNTNDFPLNGIGIQNTAFATPVTNVTVQDNKVFGNGADGILALNTQQNHILNNKTGGNNAVGFGAFDLEDTNANCDSNVWKGNAWGSGGFNQPCVTFGGIGPAPPTRSKAAVPTNRPQLPQPRHDFLR
ncbi:MAG: SBBP repeat-containing protein [Actinomycetota bacterium]|nr:SBBP repeat-containing protein [Actinomycetota bacterium]MDQ6944865.1 SBBP repeat-containing protein [Actinomycetota bacterium]